MKDKSQYGKSGPAPKIVSSETIEAKKAEVKLSSLLERIEDQDKTIHKLHRDLVRLRETVTQLANKVNGQRN